LVIAVLFCLIFGGKKIPELMKGLGLELKNSKTLQKTDQPADSRKKKKKE
jgi:Sec-independent protein translocase protein TatA